MAVDLAEHAARVADGSLEPFLAQLHRVAGCTAPIRLSGHIDHVDVATGEVRRYFDSATQPDGTILIPCGNRRATACPSCAAVYAADAWHIVHTGLTGGAHHVPPSVAEHPALFVTVTAPSFGPVHSRRAAHGAARVCRPRRGTCPHGRPAGCYRTHTPDDPALGQALCPQCFDYRAAVLWNATCARLWKRTVDLCYRRLAAQAGWSEKALRETVRISYVKVAEMQARGLVHYHAVLRLDGIDPADPEAFTPPDVLDPFCPHGVGTALAACWRWAIGHAAEPCPAPDGAPSAARWGEQADIEHLTLTGGAMTTASVGRYLAKYATKSATDSGVLDRPIRTTDDLFTVLPFLTAHQGRLVRAAWDLGARRTLADTRLRHNAHAFGYRGHWMTKSRRYSTTFGHCRTARRDWARTHHPDGTERTPLDAWGRPLEADTEDQVLVLGEWLFEGAGYRLPGDAQLAAMAADQARSRREATRDAMRTT